MIGTDSVCFKCAKFLTPKYDIMLVADTVPSKLQTLWCSLFLDRYKFDNLNLDSSTFTKSLQIF